MRMTEASMACIRTVENSSMYINGKLSAPDVGGPKMLATRPHQLPDAADLDIALVQISASGADARQDGAKSAKPRQDGVCRRKKCAS